MKSIATSLLALTLLPLFASVLAVVPGGGSKSTGQADGIRPFDSGSRTSITDSENDLNDILLDKERVNIHFPTEDDRPECYKMPTTSPLHEECKTTGEMIHIFGMIAVVCREFSGTYCAKPVWFAEEAEEGYEIFSSALNGSKVDLLNVD